jgi:hypothetical protein
MIFVIILLINNPVDARFHITTNPNKEKRDCILYNYPSQAFCDIKYSNRISAKAYIKVQTNLAIIYLIILISILALSVCCR